MTPGARVAAAIDVIDAILAGASAEQALSRWARGSRYAGSKDRAAVRDHVFDVLRARRSLGDGDGRSLMLRLAQREGWVLDDLFNSVFAECLFYGLLINIHDVFRFFFGTLCTFLARMFANG